MPQRKKRKRPEQPDGMERQMPSENSKKVFRRHFVYRV
ncbi:Exodeoxyribonuclease V gamma chain [Neisseria meningitidis serogroup B]|uniref:Exodeoxyribonuclease V gamma chain n=1 Tax=Neisseria meningitidis serogroup B TaxID=491 RepID=A0A0H5DM78_NEIMI|nr:Exodeoxyribonuclease V gamma chain [Neisseria meningitidis serogroup B]